MNQSMKIKAITLDLDDTLWPIDPVILHAEEVLHTWLEKNAPQAAKYTSVDEARQIRKQVEAEHPEWQHDLGLYRLEAIRRILKRSAEDESLALDAFHVYLNARQNVTLYTDALPALKRLSSRFPLVAITNGNADLKHMGLDHYFENIVTAKQMKASKPDPRLFQQAQKLLGLEPAHILHIGDDFHTDVTGALKVGMQAAWVQRAAQPVPAHLQAHQPQYIVEDLMMLCEQIGI